MKTEKEILEAWAKALEQESRVVDRRIIKMQVGYLPRSNYTIARWQVKYDLLQKAVVNAREALCSMQ